MSVKLERCLAFRFVSSEVLQIFQCFLLKIAFYKRWECVK